MGKVIELKRGAVTEVELEGIRRFWLDGESYETIAEKARRSARYIEKIIHEELGYARPRFSDEELEKMRTIYEQERMTTAQIGVLFGIGDGCAYYWLTKAKAKMRRRGWRQKTDSRWQASSTEADAK